MKAIKNYKNLYIDNNGTYKIRIVIPPKVKEFYKTKNTITYSLKTKDLHTAIPKYHDLMASIRKKFNLDGKFVNEQERPTCPDDIFEKKLLEDIFHYFSEYSGKIQTKFLKALIKPNLEYWEINLIKEQVYSKNQEWIEAAKIEIMTGNPSQLTLKMLENLKNSQYNFTHEQTHKALTAFAQTLFEAATFYKKTQIETSCQPSEYPFTYDIVKQAYLKHSSTNTLLQSAPIITVQTQSQTQPEAQTNVQTHTPTPVPSTTTVSNTTATVSDTLPKIQKLTTIKDILNKWIETEGDNVKEKEHHIRAFIKYYPEKELLNDITDIDIIEWIDALQITPIHINRIPEFKGLSPLEIINKNKTLNYPCLTKKTINTYLNSFSCLHKWAKRKRYITSPNPTMDTLFSKKETVSPAPETYTDKEIRQIIKYFENHKLDNVELYWAFMIIIYTGVREGEVCQLRTTDIINRDGVYCFDINDRDNKTIKNTNSKRQIPIHQNLIDLDILDYVDECKRNQTDKLFPSFRIYKRGNRNSFNKCLSEPIARILESLGLKKDRRLIHSLRHTFIDALRQAGLVDDEIQYLVGHTKQLMTSRYGNITQTSPIKTYQEWINKVDYYKDTKPAKTGN